MNSSFIPNDGADAVTRLAAMVHLLEGSESPKYQRLMRRAQALRATSHAPGSAGVLATEGSSSLATLAAAHASRGDNLEASRLQLRALEYESADCRRCIREYKRSMMMTERQYEVANFPDEPLLVKREDLSDSRVSPPNMGGHLAVLAEMYATLADYQEAARNELEAHASRRKVRTLRAAIGQ